MNKTTFTLKTSLGETKKTSLEVNDCNKNPTSLSEKLGDCNYYMERFKDFMERHKNCKHMPPVYYFGEMREISSWSLINDTKEWWTPSLTKEMEDISLKVEIYEKQGNKYKPIPSTSYGFKYCVRFSRVLYYNLTTEGQEWLIRTKNRLQNFMEEGVVFRRYVAKNDDTMEPDIIENKFNDNFSLSIWEKLTLSKKEKKEKIRKNIYNYYLNIELDNERFKEFAFATHPDAYNPEEMSKLSVDDLLKIISTPDAKEFLDAATWRQVFIMAQKLNYEEITKSTLRKIFNDMIKKIMDKTVIPVVKPIKVPSIPKFPKFPRI